MIHELGSPWDVVKASYLRIEEDIKMTVFDGSLTSYKRKDDLVTIAGTLSLPRDRTVVELTARIKEQAASVGWILLQSTTECSVVVCSVP